MYVRLASVRLTQAGATRIKINHEQENAASNTLNIDVGFRSVMTTSLWVKKVTSSA